MAEPHQTIIDTTAIEVDDSGLVDDRGLFGRIWDRFIKVIPAALRRLWPVRMIVLMISLIRRNRVMSLAAEIGFWGVLSVVPLLLVLASALGWLDGVIGRDLADSARRELAEQVTVLFGTDGTAATSIDRLFEAPATGAFTFGLITALYSASRGFTSLVGAIGLISGRRSQRNWLMTRVVGVLVLVLSVLVLVGLLVIFGVGRSGFGLPDPWANIVSYGIFPVAIVVVIAWALVLLHSAPARRTPVANDLPGATLTALLWVVGSYLTSLYIRATSSATDLLGLLGSGTGLLIWLYVVSSSILIGAQFNSALRIDRGLDPLPPKPHHH